MRNLRKSLFGLLTGVTAFVGLTGVVAAQGYDYYDYSGAGAASAGAFGLVFTLIYCCVIIFGIIIHLATCYYLYKDAEAKKIEGAVVWAVLYFFFSGLALLAYFYFNRDWTKRFGITSQGKDFVEKAVDDVKGRVEDMKEKMEEKKDEKHEEKKD